MLRATSVIPLPQCVLLSGFESLQKLFAKSKSVIDKEGVPRFFIKALAELEDFTKEVSYTFRCQ